MKKELIIKQEGNKDCGASCLLSIIRYYGGNISIERLLEMTKTTKEGTNFYSLSIAASKVGLMTKCFKVDSAEKLKEISTPFIAHIIGKNFTHFVVVYKINDNKIIIMDPATGKKTVDIFDFSNNFSGNIMIFEKVNKIFTYQNKNVLLEIIISTLYKNKGNIMFIIILSLICTIITAIASFYTQIIFDKVIDTEVNNIIIVTIFFSILYILNIITNYIRNHLLIYLNQKIDISIILSSFSKIILLPYTYYKNKTKGEVLSKINDLTRVKSFISKIIISVFLDLLTFIVSLIILYNISSKIMFFEIMIILIYILIIIIFNKVIKKITIINQENISGTNNFIIESVGAFESIKNLNVEENIIYKFSKIYSKTLNGFYKIEKINNVLLSLKELTTNIGILLIEFICIKYIMNNKMTIGTYFTISFLTSYLLNPIQNITSILGEYHFVKSSIKRANNLLDVEEEKIYEDKKLEINGNILVQNLTFTYNNKYNILSNINFYIRDKERVLILGPSGTGKSTIMKLLYKYYDIPRDKIFINNYDINDYSLSDIRKNITYISQNEELFNTSIRNNILVGRGIKENIYLNICKLTYVDEIVKENILGYDYIVEENASNISGGQKDRIILARGLLKDSKIIMIDEGLSQLDINLERKILKNIFYAFYDKTFIVISHRSENMDLYDRMIKIDKDKALNYERGKYE